MVSKTNNKIVRCKNPDKELKVTKDIVYNIESENNLKTHYQIRGDDDKLVWVFQKDFVLLQDIQDDV